MPEIANPNVDAPLLWEQVRNVAGGMDAFSDPAELDANACQTLVNILIRDKRKARTRPPRLTWRALKRRGLTLATRLGAAARFSTASSARRTPCSPQS